MRKSFGSRIEQHLVEVIELYDALEEVNLRLSDNNEAVVKPLEFINEGSKVQMEEVDEQIKAKLLFRVVKEYRKTIEEQR